MTQEKKKTAPREGAREVCKALGGKGQKGGYLKNLCTTSEEGISLAQ